MKKGFMLMAVCYLIIILLVLLVYKVGYAKSNSKAETEITPTSFKILEDVDR